MRTDEVTTSPLEQFVATMESLGIEPGSGRIDAFLGLPEQVQDAIWAEVVEAPELKGVGARETL